MHYDIDRAALSAPALDDLLAARVREDRTPSVAYALVADGRVVHAGGFANEAVTPTPGPDTAFRIASCTKSFTAVAMLQLRDAGLLDLDAPVSEYLPLTTIPDAAPTVAHLASMAAGLPTDDPWGDRQESLPLDVLDALAAAGFRLIDAPGARFEYSNLGYALLGRVLARVSGRRVPRPRPRGRARAARPDRPRLRPGRRGARRHRHRLREVRRPVGAAAVLGPGRLLPDRWPLRDAERAGPLGRVARGRLAARTPTTPCCPPRRAGMRRPPASRSRAAAPTASGCSSTSIRGTACSSRTPAATPATARTCAGMPASGIGIVVLENGRYSGATLPATKGLELVLDQVAVPDGLPDLWPETLAARETVERLLRGWDDAAADALFAENIVLDESIERRRARIDELTARAGIDAATPVPAARGRRPGQPHARASRLDGAGCDGGAALRDPPDARAAADGADAGRAPRLIGRLSPAAARRGTRSVTSRNRSGASSCGAWPSPGSVTGCACGTVADTASRCR